LRGSATPRRASLAFPPGRRSLPCDALHVQQAFRSPNRTNNFVVDGGSGRLYLAAVNAIYQLDASLRVESEQPTGPVLDNVLCHAPQLPQAPCEHPKSLTDNFNKLLQLDPQQRVLVACGSVYQGFCELRRMENISQIAVEFPPPGAKTVFPSMLNIAANDPNASTVGLVFRSHGGHAKLLVGATYTGVGTQFFPKNHSKEDLRFENTPEIAIRSLNIKELPKLFTYDINPSEDNVFKIKQEVKQKNKLSFVHAFVQKSYSYIAINNDANLGHKESQPNSILARICLDAESPRRASAESRKLTESYIQMFLQCGSNGNIYNRLVSVYPAEISPYLFGVFSKAGRHTALCAFRFADIEEAIRQGRRNCSSSSSSEDVQVLDSVIQGSGAVCVQKGNIVVSLQPEQLDCGAAHLQHPLALRRPLAAAPLFESVGLSSVAVDDVHNRTVVFLGTGGGRLRKLNLLPDLSVANQRSLKVAAGEPVHHIMTFDPSDRDYLYLMTSNHLLRVKVSKCDQYGGCRECLSAGDAHCGWCTLQSRCSIRKECGSQLAHSWIGVGEGPQRCPSMTITPPDISIASDNLGILINGSVPDLQGFAVECDYGPSGATAATVHSNGISVQIQTCSLLPRVNFPRIPVGKDHVTVAVSVKVDGVPVVSGSFTLYDCEKTGTVHPKMECNSCLGTRWKCYWDQEKNSCLFSKNTSEDLIPGVSVSPQRLSGNQEPNTNELRQRLITAVLQKLSLVQQVAYRAGECNGCASLLPPVEVYNCGAGSADCSQCWGREDQGHLCAWCDNTCKPRDDCLPLRTQCPGPEIHQIMPLSGPLEGGTLLTVQGKNLGRRVSDVNVAIGSIPCRLLHDRYTVSTRLILAIFAEEYGISLVVPRLVVLRHEFAHGPRSGGRNDANAIECRMPAAENTRPETVPVCVEFEDLPCQNLQMSSFYSYEKNPIITTIQPQKSHLSGGRTITVKGQGFNLVQTVDMEVRGIGIEQSCSVQSNTVIICSSPPSPESTQASVKFYLNGVLYTGDRPVSQMDLEEEEEEEEDEEPYGTQFYMEYLEDPQFFTATKDKFIKHHPGEPLTLIINKGPNALDLAPEEYSVTIGSVPCDISFSNDQLFHCTINGSLNSHEREQPVIVQVGNFRKVIATVQLGGSELAIVVSIVVCSVLLLLCTVALVVYCTKSRRAERYWQKTLLQMEEMESQIREEIRKGNAHTLRSARASVRGLGMRPHSMQKRAAQKQAYNTFFKSTTEAQLLYTPTGKRAHTHPASTAKPNMEEGIALFSTLLNNKHFLITFVHALEQQKDFAVRDRCSLASLLTIALHGKLEYFTSIMKELLVDLIDASASKNPKLMLRRTESVVEKMLTNWMSICMYSYLKETVGEPFFLLLCAIKQQINKGSIDAITGKARYTLNEEWLLRENIEAKPQNINVSFQGFGMDSVTVRVMNTDTICQAKEKILEAFYKNLPFSQWPSADDVDLEWFASGSNSRILMDLDNTSVMEDGRKKLNTVFHYKIPDGASLAMSLKDKRENSLGRGESRVLPNDELMETKKSHRHSHRKKVLPEIYLTRLLSTKGTLQKFLDDLFQAILSIPPDRPPLAVKYFFDFLEEQADKRGITDPDTLHIWKTNSLPLRFWVNILKNPQFVFDIDKTDHMDACLSVIAQAFIDACSTSDLQLGKDSPTNKLLYAKEIPEYKKKVQWYYRQIQEMTPLSEQEMNAHLAEESRKYRNEFNTNLALMEIYNYAKKYRNQVANALDANPTARRTQLQHKFEQVIALVEDNIYECSSEA
uniref:Plexin D1 n=1 Tax=Scleropages formosus TaxID=113540 RepID=A0A8C9RX70_SCLFO